MGKVCALVRSMLTPEVEALVGTISESETNKFAISREMVYDLADAVEYKNPLFLDIEYARRGRFKRLICPPLSTWKEWRQNINYFGAGQEGILEIPTTIKSYGYNGGAEWTFYRPAFVGDLLTRHYEVTDVYEKEGRSGMLIFVEREEIQHNQNGEIVLKARRTNIFRELKEQSLDLGDTPEMRLPCLSPPYRNENVVVPSWKFSPQKWFEGIVVGQELPGIIKGPVTTTHLVRWAAANGNYARIHWDLPFAVTMQNLPNVVVNGSLKNQYFGELLMRFAGDEGWLRRYYIEHRGMDFAGDVLVFSGRVTALKDKGDYGLVECEIELENRRGRRTAYGNATVTLPKLNKSLPLEWKD